MMRLALAALALLGFTSSAFPLTPELFPEITLQGGVGTPVAETGVTLLLTNVQDDRCPADVDCVWEGMIRVEITVLSPGPELQEIVLCNACENAGGLATAAGLTFGLVALAPSKADLAKLGRAPLLTDYAVTVTYAPAGN